MSKQRIELSASSTKTAGGNTDAFKLSTLTMAMVGIDITAVDTLTDFTAWLEASDDGGTTWYEVVADHALEVTGIAAPATPQINARDIVDGAGAAGRWQATFKHLPADYVRLAWTINGTSATFSASLVGA